MDLGKVNVVLKWEKSINVIEICSFFGLVGYYKIFVERLSTIASHLTQLTRKEVKFKW